MHSKSHRPLPRDVHRPDTTRWERLLISQDWHRPLARFLTSGNLGRAAVVLSVLTGTLVAVAGIAPGVPWNAAGVLVAGVVLTRWGRHFGRQAARANTKVIRVWDLAHPEILLATHLDEMANRLPAESPFANDIRWEQWNILNLVAERFRFTTRHAGPLDPVEQKTLEALDEELYLELETICEHVERATDPWDERHTEARRVLAEVNVRRDLRLTE